MFKELYGYALQLELLQRTKLLPDVCMIFIPVM